MHTLVRYCIGIATVSCALTCLLFTACNHQAVRAVPRFSGRLLLLAGENTNGANLFELSAAPTGSTYNYSLVASGVFEAAPSPDRTQLLYTTTDEILLRDLRTGDLKPLVKGENFCLAWSPDGKRFSYKQKTTAKENAPISAAPSKLFVSDLEGKAKMIWEDPFARYGATSPPGQSAALERAAGTFGCAQWIATDRLIFDRLLGALPKQTPGAVAVKPNTTTLAILSDPVKLTDTDRKWSIESVCQAGTAAFVRPPDQNQPILVAKSLDSFKTLNPSPISCSDCRFLGFAAKSCVPFFIEPSTATSSELFYLNPANWQRQRGTRIERTFSANARALIKSSAKSMVVGDAPDTLLLIDTESGDMVPFFPKAADTAPTAGRLMFPVPVVWIEN